MNHGYSIFFKLKLIVRGGFQMGVSTAENFVIEDISQEKLSVKEKVGYASGDLACNFIYATVSSYLLFFYTDVFGISAAAAGTMFLFVRVFDAVNDPIMGAIVDKTNTRYGRFRPFLLFGALPFAILAILCFTTPSFSDTGKLVYAYITYVGLSMAYTVVNIPYGALTAAMTRNTEEIVSLTSIRMLFANIGGLIVSFGVPLLAETFTGYTGQTNVGWQIAMTIMGVMGAALLIFCFLNTKERVKVTESQGSINIKDILEQFKVNRPLVIVCLFFIFNFGVNSIVNSVGVYFISYNVGRADLVKWYALLSTLPALVCMPIMPYLHKWLGKKLLLFISLSCKTVGLLALWIVPTSMIPLVFGARLLAAVGTVTAGGFTWSLVPEVIDYGEYKTGKRMNGLIYALVGFFFKFGMALGGIIPGILLARFGYVANQVQTQQALTGILLLTTIIPAAFTILELGAIYFYNLDEKEHKRILFELEKRG